MTSGYATEYTLEQLLNSFRNITTGIEILAHQAVTHPATVKGTEYDVTPYTQITFGLFHASVEATANTNPGKFLIQVSCAGSGCEDWMTVYEFDATISTADSEAMTATEPVGETELAVAATADFVANDVLYIQDAGTVDDSEWGLCQEIVTDTSIDLVDGLARAKDSSDVIWNDADQFACSLDVSAIGRIRVLFMHEGATGANCHIKCMAIARG